MVALYYSFDEADGLQPLENVVLAGVLPEYVVKPEALFLLLGKLDPDWLHEYLTCCVVSSKAILFFSLRSSR